MKRRRTVVILVEVLVVVLVAAYVAPRLFFTFTDSYHSVKAILMTAEESLTTSGYILRDESTIPYEADSVTEYLVEDGEKVRAGQTIIVNYANEEAVGSRTQLRYIETQLAQLDLATASDGTVADTAQIDGNIKELICSLNSSAARGDLSSLEDSSTQLKALVLERDYANLDPADIAAKRQTLLEEQTRLQGLMNSAASAVTAPASGYFTRVVDGYEGILTSERYESITVSELQSFASSETEASSSVCGKLVSGFTWYFAVSVPAAYAGEFTAGQNTTVRFLSDYIGSASMRIVRVGEEEDGQVPVVFSSSVLLRELISLRYQSVDIIFSSYEGVKVPKAAVRISADGEIGIFRNVGMQARFVAIETIYESDDYYIAHYDPANLSGLRPGDEIITSSRDIYEGKVLN